MTAIDTQELEHQAMAFLGDVLDDAGAAMTMATVALGDRLGLYKAMAGAGPITAEQLASKTGLNERYVREWLDAQVGANYVHYDESRRAYELPDAHVPVLADETSPMYLAGVSLMLSGIHATEDRLIDGFRTGAGVGWNEHPPSLFSGTAKFFRAGYLGFVVQEWLPALHGVLDKLERGAKVADIGCGFGHSTTIMARAFPASDFVGFDYHAGSIEAAREAAHAEGLDRARFDVAPANAFPGTGYDLVTSFDCVHDMGDPGAVARQVLRALSPDGTWMIVEPNASGRLIDNVNPVGKLYLAASLLVCLPSAIAQHGPVALGNHAGEQALRDIVQDAGFTRWRRAAETPTNVVYEARP